MAGHADGSIVIDTEIDTKGFSAGSKEMQRALRSLQAKVDGLAPTLRKALSGNAGAMTEVTDKASALRQTIASLESQMEALEGKRLPTEDYSWLQTEIAKAEKELDGYLAKQDRMEATGASKSSRTWKLLQYDIDLAKRKIEEYRGEMAWMENQGTAFKTGAETAEYEQLRRTLDATRAQLDRLTESVNQSDSAFVRFGRTVGGTAVRGTLKLVAALGKGAAAMLGLSLRAKKSHSSFSSGLKTMLRYGLGVRSLFALINKLRTALVDGYKNLAQYSDRTNAAISSIMSALTRLKNSFAAAFDPILTTAAPALTALINLLSDAASRVGMLTAALTGAATYTKAVAVQENYAASLKGTASAAKEAKKALASFDELNILSSGAGDSDASAGGSVDPSAMFTTVPVDSAVKDFADRLRAAFEAGNWQELGSILGSKVNALLDGIEWDVLGAKLGYGLNGVISTAYSLLKTVDFHQFGAYIASAVNAALAEIDFNVWGRLLVAKFTSALDFLLGLLGGLNWAQIGTSISGFITGALQEAAEWISSYDWSEIGAGIWDGITDFLAGLDGEALIGSFCTLVATALNALAELIAGFVDTAIPSLVDGFMELSPAGKAVAGILAGFAALMAALNPVPTAIGLIVVAISEIIAHWDDLKQMFADAGTWWNEHVTKPVQAAFQALDQKVLGLKDSMDDAWSDMCSVASDAWNSITQTVSSVWEDLKSKALRWGSDLIDNFTKGISDGVGKVKSAISGVAQTISSYIHFSVPDTGPLADADSYMPDFMTLLAKGITKYSGQVTKAVQTLADDMSGTLSDGLSDIKNDYLDTWAEIGENTDVFMDSLRLDLKSDMQDILFNYTDAWEDMENVSRLSIKKILSDTQECFGELTSAAGTFGSSISSLGGYIEDFGKWIGSDAVVAVGKFVSSVGGGISKAVGFAESIGRVVTSAKDLVGKLSSVVGWLKKLGAAASSGGGTASAALEGIKTAVTGVVSTVGKAFGGGGTGILSTIGAAAGKIGTVVSGGFKAVAAAAGSLAGSVGTAVSGAVAGASSALTGLGTAATAALGTAGVAGLAAVAGVAIAGLSSKVNSYAGQMRQQAQQNGNYLKSMLWSVVEAGTWLPAKTFEVGKNIVAGIGNGIKKAATGLWNGVKKVGSTIVKGFTSFFGIHSPSTLMDDKIGAMLPPGIGNGFVSAMPALLKTVKSRMGDLVDTMRGAAEKADSVIAGSGVSKLGEIGSGVDLTSGLDSVLNSFSGKVTDSFSGLLDKLSSITRNVTFEMPAVAAGTVLPYSVAASVSSGSSAANVADTIETSNDELCSVVIQAVTNATTAIVESIRQYGGTEVNIDERYVGQMAIKEINRQTIMAGGRSPLVMPKEV